MFSILQKSQDNVNAEDLEILQNEIERRLVDIISHRWELERELDALSNTSPDSQQPLDNLSEPALGNKNSSNNNSTTPTLSTSSSLSSSTLYQATNIPSGKLRHPVVKLNHVDPSTENASDGFKGSQFITNNFNNAHNAETDSVSSESSLVSNLTGSTIITSNLGEYGTQQNSTLAGASKRGPKNSSNDRPSKRFRQNSCSYQKRPSQSKHKPFRNYLEKSRPNKNEAPDKLWPFVEQFCATPTEEQIQDLEGMIKSIDSEDYCKIPTTSKGEKKKSKADGKDEASLGALTQRLVSSFIEESAEGPDASKTFDDSISSTPTKKRPSKNSKGIDANSAKNLEKKIRQQLEEYSILSNQDDIPYTSEDDDVLRELIACQHELLSIQNQNKHLMQFLLKKAKRHRDLQCERKKLEEANIEIFTAHQRLIQARQRKRNPTKKEKDAAWKALKTHESIFKKCDELYMSNLDR